MAEIIKFAPNETDSEKRKIQAEVLVRASVKKEALIPAPKGLIK